MCEEQRFRQQCLQSPDLQLTAVVTVCLPKGLLLEA
jgi:hypothetical protein